MSEHSIELRERARRVALGPSSMCRRPLCRAVAVALLVVWPVAASALGEGGLPSQKNRPAADPGEKILVVRVTSDGKPVARAEVVAFYVDNLPVALTDRDGLARVPLPPGGKIAGLVALHPTRGMGGQWFNSPTRVPTTDGAFHLALFPPRPHTFRVVDWENKPIPNVRCVVETVWWPHHPWMSPRGLAAAHFETDAHGEGRLAWIPRSAWRLAAVPPQERWRMDECSTEGELSTVHVRPLEPVSGRLHMPDGASAEGLVISADGKSGLSPWPHDTQARVRHDGTFTIYLAAGDAYSVELTDRKWASDAWTGQLPRDKAPPTIDLVAYPATPLTVRVTRGSKHEPVADASINLTSSHPMHWNGGHGDSMMRAPGKEEFQFTDATGTARFFVGKGQYSLSLFLEKPGEGRTVNVTSSQPVLVEMNGPSNEERRGPQGHAP